MATTVFKVRGMDCADEAARLRAEVGCLTGVEELSFDVLNARMTIVHQQDQVGESELVAAVGRTGMRTEPWRGSSNAPADQSIWDRYGRTVLTTLSGVCLVAGFASHAVLQGWFAAFGGVEGLAAPLISRLFYSSAVVAGAWFVAPKGVRALQRLRPDMNLLMMKWLGAYQPMGLGFYGRRRSRQLIDTVLEDMLESGDLDDPLLRFSRELESDEPGGLGETVNLASLFACQGAVSDALRAGTPRESSLESRLENLEAVAAMAPAIGWSPLLPAPALRSGILLIQAEGPKACERPPEAVRSTFAEAGVAITAYAGGLVRLSMPTETLRPELLGKVQNALRLAA